MKEKCKRCGGTGYERDHKLVGTMARRLRNKERLSLRECAERMGISHGYLQDLEYGRRAWNDKLYDTFLKAVTP